jgi:hypothetical protein
MQIPWAKAGSQLLLDLGNFHLAALDQSETTKALGNTFRPTVEALAAAKMAREQAEQGLIKPRVAARFAEYALECVLREIASLAHNTDNKAGGDLVFKAIFPNGLDAEVRPRGAAQLTVSTALRDRLDSQPAAATVKAQAMNEFDAALGGLDAAIGTKREAERVLVTARAAEDGARARFVSGYDSNAGAIRQMFPRNRARQDLHFDQFRTEQGGDTSGNGDKGGEVQPATGGGSNDPKKG